MLRDKAIPLYYQIETILKSKILREEFEPGALLPTESALAQEYRVSRVTVRQALSSLEKDGFIVRQRGKGTFVSQNRKSVEPAHFTGSMEDLISMGLKTSTKIIDFSLTRVAKKITDCLGHPDETEVVRIEKIRLVQGSPFSYVINYLPAAIGQKVQPEAVLKKPVLKILEDDLHIELAEAAQRLGADVADSYVASLLGVRVGDPLLKIERTVFDSSHRPVEYVSVSYRADRYAYTVRLERKKTEETPHWSFRT